MCADRELVLSQNLNICPPGKDPKKSGEWIDSFRPLDSEGQKFTSDLELLTKCQRLLLLLETAAVASTGSRQ